MSQVCSDAETRGGLAAAEGAERRPEPPSKTLALALLLAAAAALAAGGCSSADDTGVVASPAAGGYGGASGGWSGGGGTGASGGGGGGSAEADLVVPATMALPYVVAGSGGATGSFVIVNQGGEVAQGPGGADLDWSLSGDPRLSLVSAPLRLEPGAQESLEVAFAGADEESIASSTLSVQVGDDILVAAVHAVAGQPGLPDGAWETVQLPGEHACGSGLTITLPTAPFPHTSAGFTDDTVRIFVPEGLRDVGVQDVVVHFHGHGTNVAETLASHRYEEHFCASGINGVLVVPQGPVDTASGNFGKLMDPNGLAALVQQVMVVLYREEAILSPVLGELVLTAHSGGYVAVATNLDADINPLGVSQVHLYDAIYALEATFVAYAETGGVLRSNYTPGGGTVDDNQEVIATLEQHGVAVATEPTQAALRDAPVLIYAAATSHSGATRIDGAFGDQLRFAMPRHRRGPRVELRAAFVEAGSATVQWFSPPEEDLLGYQVLLSTDGDTWTLAAAVAPDQHSATFAFELDGTARVRVVPEVAGLAAADALGSDVYGLAAQPDVLIVDGFDRVIDGSWGGLTHDFAAVVGEAAGAVGTVSNEALTEGDFEIGAGAAVIWLLGDESTADHTFGPAERDLLDAHLSGGGVVVVSGSEVAFDLDLDGQGAALLDSVFGAVYAADDSGSYTVTGVGALQGLGTLTYAGPAAAYDEDYPDVLGTAGAGAALLEYDTGGAGELAAVGISGQAALVGFPLELVDGDAAREALVGALLDFVGVP